MWFEKKLEAERRQSTKMSNKMMSGNGMPIIQSSKPLNMNLSFCRGAALA